MHGAASASFIAAKPGSEPRSRPRPAEAKTREAEGREAEPRSPGLKRLIGVWGRFHGSYGSICSKEVLATLGVDHSAADVEAFSQILASYQGAMWFGRKSGVFLSHAVNSCRESDFTLRLSNLDVLIDLCWKNSKNVTIMGDCASLCRRMISGKVVLIGHVYPFSAWSKSISVASGMRGGELTVCGDVVAQDIGHALAGGIVNIFGDIISVDDCSSLGHRMTGGEIHIHGKMLGKWKFLNDGKKKIFLNDELVLGRSAHSANGRALPTSAHDGPAVLPPLDRSLDVIHLPE
jgi:hypothetical protein